MRLETRAEKHEMFDGFRNSLAPAAEWVSGQAHAVQVGGKCDADASHLRWSTRETAARKQLFK